MSNPAATAAREPLHVVRVIARLNIGGPAIQAITLTARLGERGYTTTLVRGLEEPDEGNMDPLAARLGVAPVLVPALRRNPGLNDFTALGELVRILRRKRPAIVHTHAAKGGTLGRIATLLAFPRSRDRPVLIHTYHGHSLSGYFSPRTESVYRNIERVLARFTDRLVAVSDEVRDELVQMRVAPTAKFEVVPLGFDLSAFTLNGAERQTLRDATREGLSIPAQARVVTLIARLVPIKRVDRFLRVAAALADIPDVRFLIVGDGELQRSLKASADAEQLGDRLVWAGFRQDMPAVLFASDVVMQTSDNEGTPVALIEAQAAGVPVVSTRVGGSASIVPAELLAAPDDIDGLASRVRALLADADTARSKGAAAAQRVIARFDLDRLIDDIDRVYRRELSRIPGPRGAGTLRA